MGIDEFLSEDDNKDITTEQKNTTTDDTSESDWDFPDKVIVGDVIKRHAINKDVDIEVNGDELVGDKEQFGKLFTLMFLDYPEADPYNLEK
jgi:hypothetical protein